MQDENEINTWQSLYVNSLHFSIAGVDRSSNYKERFISVILRVFL